MSDLNVQRKLSYILHRYIIHVYLCSDMKTFNVPIIYRSPLITAIKNKRKQQDKMKKDFTPTLLDFGPCKFTWRGILVFVMAWKMPLRLLPDH